jgi:uncharacterized repeat protein (TIGR01451 family)
MEERKHRSRIAVILVSAALTLAIPPRLARGATITVTGTGDTVAVDGSVTLREAITSINNGANVNADVVPVGAYGTNDTIAFNIPGAGVHTIIQATTALPALATPVLIDGYTQPGSSPNTNALNAGINAVLLIELNGNIHGGLVINGAGTTIRGLVLNRAGDDAILINADNATITGNFIGTNPAGTSAPANMGGYSIRIGGVGGNNVVIGGPAAADRNLLSGYEQGGIIVSASFSSHSNAALIEGNYVGTDVTGMVSLAPPLTGLGINIVGGPPTDVTNAAVVGNLVSGNPAGGIQDTGTGGVVQGNLVGTQRDGVGALGNSNFAVFIGGTGITVGGSGAGHGNTIAFNAGAGVTVFNNRSGNQISQNSIHDNVNLGISLQSISPGTPLLNDPCDVDFVPGNLGQNYPVITSASIAAGNVTISGTLNSAASTTYRVEFFSNITCHASGNGEGRTFLGFATVTTDGTCNASFGPLVFAIPGGQTIITATATDPAGNTSEFSACLDAAGAPPPPSADLAVTKNGNASVAAGSNLTYTLAVSNGGSSAASNASLSDPLPANTTFVSFNAPGGWTATTPAVGGTGTVTAGNPSLANGANASFTLVVKVNGSTGAGTVISNTATVSSDTADPNGANNSSTSAATVAAAPPPAAAAIPTLSEWAMVALGLLIALLGITLLRRGH